jgi:hypothetical protein
MSRSRSLDTRSTGCRLAYRLAESHFLDEWCDEGCFVDGGKSASKQGPIVEFGQVRLAAVFCVMTGTESTSAAENLLGLWPCMLANNDVIQRNPDKGRQVVTLRECEPHLRHISN